MRRLCRFLTRLSEYLVRFLHRVVRHAKYVTFQMAEVAVTSGGRVLGVTALGEDVADAKGRAYEAVEAIHFENAYYRRDISDKAICVPG